MSRIDSFTNLSPFKTTVSRKVISFSDNSAVNFILVIDRNSTGILLGSRARLDRLVARSFKMI